MLESSRAAAHAPRSEYRWKIALRVISLVSPSEVKGPPSLTPYQCLGSTLPPENHSSEITTDALRLIKLERFSWVSFWGLFAEGESNLFRLMQCQCVDGEAPNL